jgi:hypothetical protein
MNPKLKKTCSTTKIFFKVKNPNPPNFNKTPAKIMEPIMGASTCAFGNQMWRKKKGNFTKKAKQMKKKKI